MTRPADMSTLEATRRLAQRQRELEAAVLEALRSFEADTCLSVAAVELLQERLVGARGSRVVSVVIRIEL